MKPQQGTPRKKKIIELRPETEKRLRLIAVNEGVSLKSYIENVLEKIAVEDESLIALSGEPGTKDLLNEAERADFLKSLSECVVKYQRLRDSSPAKMDKPNP